MTGVCLGYGAYNPTRISSGDDVGRNIVCDDTPGSNDTIVSYGYTRSDGNSSADPYVIPDRNRPCVFEPFVSSLDIGGVTCRIEAHVGGDEHVVAYGDGSLVEHNAIVVGKEIFAQVNVMPIVAKERRYDYEFFGCSTNDFPNEFFSFF